MITSIAAAVFLNLAGPVTPAAPSPASVAPPAGVSRLQVVVDPRVELMSILCRLAGFEEYNRGRVPGWSAAVDSQFAPLRDHDAVSTLRRLRGERGIGYDAPMSLAVHLEPGLGLALRVPLEPWPAKLDQRWTAEAANAFVAAARDFAAKGDFAGFWDRHRKLRDETAVRLQRLVQEHDLAGWFDGWFGAKAGAEFVLDAALLNGGGSYGPAVRLPDGHEELWSILGVYQTDAEGAPVFDAGFLAAIVHEFAHSYANPLVAANADALRPAGETIFTRCQAEMKKQAYGSWQTMLSETLVRGATTRWLAYVSGDQVAAADVADDSDRGFIWMGELSALLAGYERDRATYPTLSDYMPRIIAFMNDYAGRIDAEIAKAAARREAQFAELRAKGPKVVAVAPANGSRGVDPGTAAIRITFDRPMQATRVACMVIAEATFPPVAGKVSFDSTRTVLTLPVKLSAGTEYGFGLNSATNLNMRDDAGNVLAPLEVRFSTRD